MTKLGRFARWSQNSQGTIKGGLLRKTFTKVALAALAVVLVYYVYTVVTAPDDTENYSCKK